MRAASAALVLVLAAAASPFPLAAQGTDRELACRGGPGISFEKEMDPSPRDTTRAIMRMRYRASTKVMNERDYKNLDPGTCTWNAFRNPRVPAEPGYARVELLHDAQPWFKQSKTIDTAITAGAHFKDVNTVPRYLSDSRFYYSFYLDDKSLLSTVHGALYDTSSSKFVTLAGPYMLPAGTKRDIRCRGGTSGLAFGGGGNVGANLSSVTLTYGVSANMPGATGMAMSPGSCAWVDRAGVPKETGTITFTTAANAQLKQIQSGGAVDRSATAAERWPDVRSIPEYLKDQQHFWTFTVTVDQPAKALTHGAWKVDPTDIVATGRSTSTPTTRSIPSSVGNQPYTPGRAGTSSAATTVFDIKNVSVTPGLEGVAIRFDAAPSIKPTVTLTPDNGGAAIPLAVGGAPNGTMWRYSAASTAKLARNAKYAFRIDAPASGNARANSTSGSFKTLGQFVRVAITRIDILSDGDAESDGDFGFDFASCPSRALGYKRFGSWVKDWLEWSEGPHPVDVVLASTDGNAPDRFRLVVMGVDNDHDASNTRDGDPTIHCKAAHTPERNGSYEWNYAEIDFDLTRYPGVKAGDQFVRRSKPLTSSGSRVAFEVRGTLLVTRE
jgi:hypothetical protein